MQNSIFEKMDQQMWEVLKDLPKIIFPNKTVYMSKGISVVDFDFTIPDANTSVKSEVLSLALIFYEDEKAETNLGQINILVGRSGEIIFMQTNLLSSELKDELKEKIRKLDIFPEFCANLKFSQTVL